MLSLEVRMTLEAYPYDCAAIIVFNRRAAPLVLHAD